MKIIYIDDGTTAPWVATKYAQALLEGGADIEVLYLCTPSSQAIESLFDGVVPKRYFGFSGRLQRVKGPLAELRLLWHSLRERADCYIASGPRVLWCCHFLARHHKAKFVYIPCEYYPHLSYGAQETRERFASLERKYIPHIDAVVLLGDKLAEEYERIYGSKSRFHVVYAGWPSGNSLPRPVLRDVMGMTHRERIILYQGGINVRRGLLKVVEAMPLLPPEAIFVILGYGSDEALILEKARELGVADRVRILPAVPQRDLMSYTADADIGIIPILNVCRSYYLCNPGKLFEYIAAGLPLAVSNLAQLEWYVKTRGLGEVFNPEDPRDIARALLHLLEDEPFRARCAANSRATQQNEASWEIQAEKLRRIVFGLGYRTSQSAC